MFIKNARKIGSWKGGMIETAGSKEMTDDDFLGIIKYEAKFRRHKSIFRYFLSWKSLPSISEFINAKTEKLITKGSFKDQNKK